VLPEAIVDCLSVTERDRGTLEKSRMLFGLTAVLRCVVNVIACGQKDEMKLMNRVDVSME